MAKIIGATIGNKHTSEWGLGLTDYQIDLPSPKVAIVSIPYGDGSLDLTKYLNGDHVTYDMRPMMLKFGINGSYEEFENLKTSISNYLHGELMKIIIDPDPNYYYIGRLSVSNEKSNKVEGEIVLSGNCDPYKYERYSSLEPWLWDPFNFENGIIRNYKDITVDGKLTLVIPGRKKPVAPVFDCSVEMDVIYNGLAYTLPQGKSTVTDIVLGEGEHELTFIGHGVISVDYRGGSL